MPSDISCDEDLVRRLPLPLAQLYRRAHNAKTPLERHLTAFFLWEAGLKLLAAVAVVEYAERPEHDPQLAERLTNLARPALGHWWEFVRRLVPILAESDAGFVKVRDLLLGKTRDDMPRAAGLDALLREALDGGAGARSTVRFTELFDRLVQYRNRELGHGAAGQRPDEFYERMGQALLTGLAEVFTALDVLAGRRLLYVADVRRQSSGGWLVERYELIAETARRIESLDVAEADTLTLPRPDCLYLELPGSPFRLLRPLLIYDAEAGETLYLNARRGRQRTEYLCYTTGRTVDRADLGGDQRELLARVLGLAVAEEQVSQWQARSQAEEGPAPETQPDGSAVRRLGEFELLSVLGRGGMGVVYRAWQPSLGRQVALKCLLRTGDAKSEARFAREIRALGKVEHPNLVKVFTSGSEGDQWFFAMELLEGATLSSVCDKLTSRSASAVGLDMHTWQEALSTVCEEARKAEKPLSDQSASGEREPPDFPGAKGASGDNQPDRNPVSSRNRVSSATRGYIHHIVELIRQVAEAAQTLHEAGVLHRDIKPGNIVVSADGAHAVLMDLGLAQVADDVQGKLTRTRQFVGTLRYASPEQVLAAGTLDRRSDVYSLGATLWELLTLKPLFGADEQTPTPELMQRIQYEEPGRLRAHHPGIAADLDAIVQKCLEKDPRRRYPSARELAEDLGRYLEGETVQARPVRGWERGLKWVKRRPAVAALMTVSAVAMLTLVGGLVGLFYSQQLHTTNVQLAEAKEEAEKQRDEARQARGQVEKERELGRRYLYAASMNLANRAWQETHIGRMLELLDSQRPERTGGTDLRGFEWHYLWRLCHSELFTFKGLSGDVSCVAFSPDGRRLASASTDRTVKLWDVGTRQVILTMQGHTSIITSLAFRPDGRRLASASYDKTVKVWDAETGQEVLTLKGSSGQVGSVAFSPDGLRLASDWDGLTSPSAKVWDAKTGREVFTLKGHSSYVGSVAFSPDGRRLATASGDKTAKVWDAKTGQETLTIHTGAGNVAFSPDGRRLATSSGDQTAKVWDAETGKEALTLKGHTDRVGKVAFSPDGRRLVTTSIDRTMKVWDAETGQETLTLKGPSDGFGSVAFSPDGRRLVSASDETIKVWDVETDQEALTLKGPAGGIGNLAFSPDGRRLASASGQTVKVLDSQTGQEVLILKGHTSLVSSVAFSPDGRHLASASGDKTVKVWDAQTGNQKLILNGHLNLVESVTFSPDGRRLASASGDNTVKVWDAQSGKETLTLKHTSSAVSVRFSPNGDRLTSAFWDGTIKVWDAQTGQEVLALVGNMYGAVRSVIFSPDGRHLVSAMGDNTVKLLDALTGQEVRTLKGHYSPISSVAFSMDGHRLASASGDQTVKVWDTQTGQETLTLKHTASVSSVAFSRDGRRLASASADGTVKIWNADTDQ